MKIVVKHFKEDLYYDIYFGAKRYWKDMGERMIGYCMLSDTLIDHVIRPVEAFQFLDKRKPQRKELAPNPAMDALECGS